MDPGLLCPQGQPPPHGRYCNCHSGAAPTRAPACTRLIAPPPPHSQATTCIPHFVSNHASMLLSA